GDKGEGEGGGGERGKGGGGGWSQGGHSGCRQQVNGVPNAAVRNDTIEARYNCHRNPADNPALDTRRIGMNLCRNTNTVVCDSGSELLHRSGYRCDWMGSLLQRPHAHQIVLFHRQHVAKPPHRATQCENQTDHTDHGLCDQTRRKQCQAERGDKGPRRWCWQVNVVRNLFLFLLDSHLSLSCTEDLPRRRRVRRVKSS